MEKTIDGKIGADKKVAAWNLVILAAFLHDQGQTCISFKN